MKERGHTDGTLHAFHTFIRDMKGINFPLLSLLTESIASSIILKVLKKFKLCHVKNLTCYFNNAKHGASQLFHHHYIKR